VQALMDVLRTAAVPPPRTAGSHAPDPTRLELPGSPG
jgi:hypothetical protein